MFPSLHLNLKKSKEKFIISQQKRIVYEFCFIANILFFLSATDRIEISNFFTFRHLHVRNTGNTGHFKNLGS